MKSGADETRGVNRTTRSPARPKLETRTPKENPNPKFEKRKRGRCAASRRRPLLPFFGFLVSSLGLSYSVRVSGFELGAFVFPPGLFLIAYRRGRDKDVHLLACVHRQIFRVEGVQNL